jgi:hypothetical protein
MGIGVNTGGGALNNFEIFEFGGGTKLTVQAATGHVGIGNNLIPTNGKLHVESAAGKDTAVFASTLSGSLVQVGVYGTYNTSGYGAGVVGRGFGGADKPTTRDIGVFGTSGDIAVWSQGKLKVLDGTEGAGKVLTSDATGTASWSGGIGFAAIGSASLPTGVTNPRIYATESYDDGNGYNPVTGIYTAPVAGIYHFAFEEGYSAAANVSQLHCSFTVNGVFPSGTFGTSNITTLWGVGYARDFKLNAGDQVAVRIFNSTAAAVNPSGVTQTFSGHLVR